MKKQKEKNMKKETVKKKLKNLILKKNYEPPLKQKDSPDPRSLKVKEKMRSQFSQIH